MTAPLELFCFGPIILFLSAACAFLCGYLRVQEKRIDELTELMDVQAEVNLRMIKKFESLEEKKDGYRNNNDHRAGRGRKPIESTEAYAARNKAKYDQSQFEYQIQRGISGERKTV